MNDKDISLTEFRSLGVAEQVMLGAKTVPGGVNEKIVNAAVRHDRISQVVSLGPDAIGRVLVKARSKLNGDFSKATPVQIAGAVTWGLDMIGSSLKIGSP